MKYLCVFFNEDASHIIKYRCIYYDYIIECNNCLSKCNKFINIYEITKTNNYKLKNIKYDKIISVFGKDDKYVDLLENLYNIKFDYLRKIKEYLLSNNYINYRGIETLDIIINYEFKNMGLKVRKFSEDEINEFNEKSLKYFTEKEQGYSKKYELLLIKNISKSKR